MDQPTQEVKDEVRKSVDEMKLLLDEVRGRLRNAGSDTREAFDAISKDAEQLARDMSVASSHAFANLIRRLRELVNRVGADLRR
jgi:uncharacterized membrane-anchored protein YhcB (DUF1043 family)